MLTTIEIAEQKKKMGAKNWWTLRKQPLKKDVKLLDCAGNFGLKSRNGVEKKWKPVLPYYS